MSKKTPKIGWISTVAQVKALTSPIRHQMRLAMEMLGPCSIRELAARMGREPATLYYHINIMEKVGVLSVCGTQREGLREEALYELVGKRIRIDTTQRSPRFKKAVASGCSALLRYAERTLVAALGSEATVKTGKASDLQLRQVSVRLSKSSLIKLNAKLDELHTFINNADSPDADSVYAITVCLAPIASVD